ncbi:MAG: aminodeoxychorismate synthase component I [Desulfobacteraceae bacterium]|nr:aminodeoxychorismate synthase component I [Desulfobacteraceae bacterium]
MPDAADIQSMVGCMEGVRTEEIAPRHSFSEMAGCFADLPGTVILASGGDLETARYHLLAVRPWLAIKSWGATVQVESGGESRSFQGDPFDLLRQVLCEFDMSDAGLPEPVSAGLFGYLSYDLKDFIEDLPRTTLDDSGLPELCLYAPSVLVIADRRADRFTLCMPVFKDSGDEGPARLRDWFFDRLRTRANPESESFAGGGRGFWSPFTRETYMDAVACARDYIAAGHIYQVNFSQRFETDFSGSPYALFAELFSAAPAAFYAYVHAGDHWIVSTSPERFLKQRRDLVETRPIKGTRPRGASPAADRAMAAELKSSSKDDAELSMIVDLMRNDLGRVCAGGSVEVVEHRRLEAYHNVFHLVSVVRGRLAQGRDSVDLLRAAFPGGSVTGCPRIRAMEIIDELEPCRRHVYTGSIGYIGFHQTMDLSIAIRTVTIENGRMRFSVGGGVVYDSDPAEEYEETLHKGRSVMGVFEGRGTAPAREATIWMDGMVVPASRAHVPVTDPGLQYGYGFFETIRVDRGRPHLLESHLERFYQSWQALFAAPVPDLTWETVISQAVAANNLGEDVCVSKLMALAAVDSRQPHLVVTAAPYVHRLDQLGKPALDLAVYTHPRHTPLAAHKTLNYLYYFLAGRWARENGADEAVILNADGTISETNTANLLIIRGNTVISPASSHVLAGVMEAAILEILTAEGFHHAVQPLTPEALFDADALIATNSLMGPVSVRSLDGRQIPCDPHWTARLRDRVFSEFS